MKPWIFVFVMWAICMAALLWDSNQSSVRPGQTITITIPQCAPALQDETGISTTGNIYVVTPTHRLEEPPAADKQFDPIPYVVPKAPQPDIPGRKEA